MEGFLVFDSGWEIVCVVVAIALAVSFHNWLEHREQLERIERGCLAGDGGTP